MSSTILSKAYYPATFDAVAAEYDGLETRNALMQWMRQAVQRLALRTFPSGSRLLDLGCGTGTDTLFFAQQGFRIVAVDPSRAMLATARLKLSAAGFAPAVDFVHASAENLTSLWPASNSPQFDGVFSNFGALNCVADLRPLLRHAARLLRPDGKMLLSLMPPICPWEILYYLLRRDPARALRRWRGRTRRGGSAVWVQGRPVQTYYHSPADVLRAGAADFSRDAQFALGLFVPPPYLAGMGRFPKILQALQRCENLMARWPVLRQWGDHCVIILRRRVW